VLDLANQTAAAGLASLANILALDACYVALALVIRSQSHANHAAITLVIIPQSHVNHIAITLIIRPQSRRHQVLSPADADDAISAVVSALSTHCANASPQAQRISAISRRCLGGISAVSRRYLGGISAVPPQHAHLLRRRAAWLLGSILKSPALAVAGAGDCGVSPPDYLVITI